MKFVAVSLALICAALAGCSDKEESSNHFDISHVRNRVINQYEFTLPSDKPIQVEMHGRGSGPDDYADIKSFDLSEANGHWQIWVAHNVWSNNPNQSTSFSERNRQLSTLLAALWESKVQNNLDVEINFLQVDKIPGRGAYSERTNTKNLSLSPIGDIGCGSFWVDCTDRYVISPFARFAEPGIMSQFDWIYPLLQPKLKDIEINGSKSKWYEHVGTGFDNNKSKYWDDIHAMAFIVNPDGVVVDALVFKSLGAGITARSIITHFIVAADLDHEEINIPKPNLSTAFLESGYLDNNIAKTDFSGDYIENTINNLYEMVK